MDDRTNFMSPRPLIAGSKIASYKIREVIGMGGLGITYRADDIELDREVAIREYLPTSYAVRQAHGGVKSISSSHERRYVEGLTNFLLVANALNRFSHENIVNVHNVFEQNNTAYMVMDCEYGVSLDSIIEQCGTLEQSHQTQIFFPIFEGLQQIHELGLLHRSIKPANIRIRENGTPVLLDFGSAQQLSHPQPIESTALVNQGYMPLEQYSADYGEQGPWTDIYSLAAIMHQGVTGAKPDEALIRSDYLLRAQPDTVEELSAVDYPVYDQAFLRAVHAGLTLQPQIRPQSLSHWQLLFDGNFEAYLRQSAAITNPSKDATAKTDPTVGKTGIQAFGNGNGNGNEKSSTLQPFAASLGTATNPADDELNMTLSTPGAADVDDEFLNAGVLAATKQNEQIGWKSIVAGSALAASIALVVSIMFLQNKGAHLAQTASEVDQTSVNVSKSANSDAPDTSLSAVATNNAQSMLGTNITTDESATNNSASAQPSSTTNDTQPTAPENNKLATDQLSGAQIHSATEFNPNLTSTLGDNLQASNVSATSTATSSIAKPSSTQTLPDSSAVDQENRNLVETNEQSDSQESGIPTMPAVFFDKPLPNDPQSDNPRTLAQIAESKPLFSPIEGMDDKYWKDKGCNDCHNWTRENLCHQGDFYHNGNDDKIDRIKHPFDGYFKLALKSWASNECS